MRAIFVRMKRQKLSLKLGAVIRQERKKRGLSQEQFAEISGFHRTYIGHVERGEKNITIVGLLKICKALGISGSDLLGRAGL